jgi:hypothetical protein
MLPKLFLAVVTLAVLVGGYAYDPVRGLHGKAARAAPSDSQLAASRDAQRLVIGIDLSQSNPLVTDSGFAEKLAERLRARIASLGFASKIHVRTFGSYGASANSFYYDAVISRNQRPEAVAAEIAKLIGGTPLLVKKGVFKTQNATNILAFLDNAAHSFGCETLKTDIILATDGIEDSEYARLTRKNAHLPPPEGKPFASCQSLSILGLGQGQKSPAKTAQLRREWEKWSKEAGFESFVGLNDW